MGNNEGLVFYVTLKIRPEKVQDWLQAVHEIIEQMSKESAFICCYLQRDASDPCSFTLFEKWREPSMDAFVAHQMTSYRLAYEEKLAEYLQSPRSAEVLEPVDQWLAVS
ncbi:putative quinol monooxygenase [Gilvimarinus sp. F26214L]|uniref:putative quinol monooxygenase n=1 Tax=Gilvimarinus sp. DZF01 TaxID=3461371 RepID=UPI0040453387